MLPPRAREALRVRTANDFVGRSPSLSLEIASPRALASKLHASSYSNRGAYRVQGESGTSAPSGVRRVLGWGLLIPTLRVGTHVPPLRDSSNGMQSVRTPFPTNERGNEKPSQGKDTHPLQLVLRT